MGIGAVLVTVKGWVKTDRNTTKKPAKSGEPVQHTEGPAWAHEEDLFSDPGVIEGIETTLRSLDAWEHSIRTRSS
jgi:hypothetical protein